MCNKVMTLSPDEVLVNQHGDEESEDEEEVNIDEEVVMSVVNFDEEGAESEYTSIAEGPFYASCWGMPPIGELFTRV